MSETVLEPEIISDDIETGKRFMFWTRDYPDGTPLGFSSKLENIGIVELHDQILKNKTEVIALSEPTEAIHHTRGPMLVTKIMAHAVMWVPTFALHFIKEE